uniref:Uncharacterized protein n=1 Tax=Avena sativa TaxID=4498 RepID=A0ACD5WU68_AVESA
MASAAFLLILLLVVAAGKAVGVGGDDAAELPHLELRGIGDSGRAYASSDEPRQGHVITERLKLAQGCGRFAALLAATANASDFFSQRIVAGGGLTVFCPDDQAVADFEPTFDNLSADDQLDFLLLHGAAARYGREQIAAFEAVQVRKFAADAVATDKKSHVLTVREDGDAVRLWTSPRGSGGAARVTKEVTSGDDSPFGVAVAVYVVDAVLLPEPDHLRQRLVGGDDVAAACAPSIGHLGWLQCTVPIWGALCMADAGVLGMLSGVVFSLYFCSRSWEDAVSPWSNQ